MTARHDLTTTTSDGAGGFERQRSRERDALPERPSTGDALLAWACGGGDLDALSRVVARAGMQGPARAQDAAQDDPGGAPSVDPYQALRDAGRALTAARVRAEMARHLREPDAEVMAAEHRAAVDAYRDAQQRWRGARE